MLIKPQVNVNGTAYETLLDNSIDIRSLLLDAAQKMQEAFPNGRDYQTGGDFPADSDEARRRIGLVLGLADLFHEDSVALCKEYG